MTIKGKIKDIYPLTPMQEGMLFHSLCETDTTRSPPYFVQTSYRLHGELNLFYVEESLNELMRRYDILRTAFIYEGRDRPLQVVLKEREMDFFFQDIRHIDGKDRGQKEKFVEEYKDKDRQRSFDLSKDVLMRVSVLQPEDREYEFIWSHHHILMDGWCKGILISEYFRIYNSYLQNTTYQLTPVKTFKLYIEWLEKKDKSESSNYWRKYLESYQETAGIPKTRIIETGKGEYKKEQVFYILDQENAARLKHLASRNNVTLNTVILSIWGIILDRYSGKDKKDVVFGAVVSGRPSEIEGVESMIGIFINTIPVRIHWQQKTTFNELLHRVQKAAIESEPHHHYPLVEVQSESMLKQNLFDHIMAFENFPITEQLKKKNEKEKGVKLKISDIDSFVRTNYDFHLTIFSQKQLTIVLNYNSNIYEKEMIERIAGHFPVLFQQILDHEETYIYKLEILSNEEKKQLLYEFNDSKIDYTKDKTIHQLFEGLAAKIPGNISIVGPLRPGLTFSSPQNVQYVSYRKLNEQSHQLAWFLKRKGARLGTIVSIMMEPSVEMIMAILAAQKVGAIFLPIEPELPPGRVRYMLNDSKAKFVLIREHLRDKLFSIPKTGPITINIDDEDIYKRKPIHLTPVSVPTDILYVIYTSGSTGRPKGVLIDNRNMLNYSFWFAGLIRLNRDDKAILTSSFAFDAIYTQLYSSLLTGCVLHAIPRETFLSPELLLDYLRKNKITYIKVTPSLFNLIVGSPDFSGKMFEKIRFIMLGGEPINPLDVEKVWSDCKHIRIMNHYGPTETTIGSIAQFIDFQRFEQFKTQPTIGKPIANTKVYILDKNARLLPLGVLGELCIGGDGVGIGYLNNPELTAEKFFDKALSSLLLALRRTERAKNANQPKAFREIPGGKNQKRWPNPHTLRAKSQELRAKLYKTGDLARWLTNGNIEFLGRIDHQVKIRGFRIELGEIESQLLNYKKVKEALVTLRKDKGENKYLCAYIVLKDNTQNQLVISELKEYLSKTLPSYMIPSYFLSLERIPLTTHNKVNMSALPDPRDSFTRDREAFAEPKTGTETKIAKIWKEVLHLGRVGLHDNFFDIGGHSINIIKVNSKLKKSFETDIPVVSMFRYPTIHSLSQYLDNRKTDEFLSDEKIEQSIDIMKQTADFFLEK